MHCPKNVGYSSINTTTIHHAGAVNIWIDSYDIFFPYRVNQTNLNAESWTTTAMIAMIARCVNHYYYFCRNEK